MTKQELVQNIAHETWISTVLAKVALETVLESIKTETAKGNQVVLRGFGNFKQVTRAAKKGWNISKNEPVDIPERQVVKFIPSKDFLK